MGNTGNMVDMATIGNEGLLPDQLVMMKRAGYCGFFARRDTIDEATTYAEEIGKACGAAPHVITAVMVYANTLVYLQTKGNLLVDTDNLGKYLNNYLSEELSRKGIVVEGLDKMIAAGIDAYEGGAR